MSQLYLSGITWENKPWVIMSILICLLIISVNILAQNNEKQPNIIFIMTDDQGYRDVGFMGHPHLKTPNLDEMAQKGLRLDRFYTASPICSPTRASVLTGRHPNRSGTFTHGSALRPQERTVVRFLREAGYRTGFFGKWHLGSVRAEGTTSPAAHGFDEWYAAPNFYLNDPWMSKNGTPVQLIGESSAITVEPALAFIEEAARNDDPFIVFIWTGAPHNPHDAIPVLRELYPDQPDNLQNYYGEITGIDQAVGQVRDGLRELDIAENTLLIFISDNGGRFPEADNGDLRGGKADLWEGGIRVPAVFEWPGFIEHRISQVPAGTVDLFPTFLELAGVNPVDQIYPQDGISLLPLMKGEMVHREEPLGFWNHFTLGALMSNSEIMQDLRRYQEGEIPVEELNEGRLNPPDLPYEGIEEYPGRAVWMEGQWKFHHNGSTGELYNLTDDLGEENNILEQHPERAQRMKEELRKWQNSVINSIRGGDY